MYFGKFVSNLIKSFLNNRKALVESKINVLEVSAVKKQREITFSDREHTF